MAFGMAQAARIDGNWDVVVTLVSSDGTAAHPVAERLSRTDAPLRDVADAVHCLCMLYGRFPGAIDHAIASNRQDAAAAWLSAAADAFAAERGYLARLTAAAGPLPSTPGQQETESAIVAAAHALEMLAQSGRVGCAIGASVALVLDWRAVREVLDIAALRLGVLPAPIEFPFDIDTASMLGALSAVGGTDRAVAFGAQQLLAQHRGLWDLLDARRSARDEQ